jgi:hypothetical protein
MEPIMENKPETTLTGEMLRAKVALDRLVASLAAHDALTCENCKQFEADRERRGQ